METTYASKSNGGAFEKTVIPELTQISLDNESFSDSNNEINGAHALYGSTWTTASMFAQISGLPLKITTKDSGALTEATLFKNTTMLGDILNREGYNNVLLQGSSISFGGIEHLFSYHGDYSLYDYDYALENEWIPKGYKVFWGYEDEKLFYFAKEQLKKLSKENQPFNLTIATIDTHFEDGYKCRLCPTDEYDDQYSAVMACSSKQVSNFIEWIKEQDFYEDTVIILSGDHPTMDSDFCDNVPSDYDRRTYFTIINSDKKYTDLSYKREYSTFDLFPTTLAAIGAEIEGNRLGLGTNLYSNGTTLLERDGKELINAELSKKTLAMEKLQTLDYSESANDSSAIISCSLRDYNQILITAKLHIPRMDYELFDNYYIELISSLGNIVTKKLNVTMTLYGTTMVDSANCTEIVGLYAMRNDSNERYDISFDMNAANLSYYHSNISSYLNYLTGKDNLHLLIACDFNSSNDRFSQNMKIIERLNDVGITFDSSKNESYDAYVVCNGRIENRLQSDSHEVAGIFSDNVKFYIKLPIPPSEDVLIEINNKEFHSKKNGILTVVYDSNNGKIVDSNVFNTVTGEEIPSHTYEEYCNIINSIPMNIVGFRYDEESDVYNYDIEICKNDNVTVLGVYACFRDISGNQILGMRSKNLGADADEVNENLIHYYFECKANWISKHISKPYTVTFEVEISETPEIIQCKNISWSFAEFF